MIEMTPLLIEEYATRHTTPMSELHERLWRETHDKTTRPQMMVGALEGAILRILARLIQARRILEIGTFTGYSGLAWAEALPPDGQLITLDFNPETAEIARRFFAESPHRNKIDFRLGPALESLKTLEGPFDLCFIDADKREYSQYYEICLGLLRQGGLIVLDNMLQRGRVLDQNDESSRGIDSLNRR
ncbi:MAG: methyltransferase domain-containing protein, partial [Deltaproteobacteria bacterium]|nr:methyltransferase domain-containing protein [Deltaproteobacteria bacterium]